MRAGTYTISRRQHIVRLLELSIHVGVLIFLILMW